MAAKCKQEHCFPDETGCNMGAAHPSECEFCTDKEVKTLPSKEDSEGEKQTVGWTGNSMGSIDLTQLSARQRPFVIGVVGAAGAGKTTFLALVYSLLRSGSAFSNYRFAGSFTLRGWENIAVHLTWKPGNIFQFPPHTSTNAGRIPGLLHLALKGEYNNVHDIVFTDAPGEWFSHWIINKDNENAKGANWIDNNADAFIVFADCEALAGEKRGTARTELKHLSVRLRDNIGERPVALIWSKSDIKIEEPIRTAVKREAAKITTSFKEFEISYEKEFHRTILDTVEWLLEITAQHKNKLPEQEVKNTNDMFFMVR